MEPEDLWNLFMSGVIVNETFGRMISQKQKTTDVLPSEQDVLLSLWLCGFVEEPSFKKVVLLKGLSWLEQNHLEHYESLKKEHSASSGGWFSSVVSKVNQWKESIDRAFTSEIPTELNLEETFRDAINEIPEEERPHLFQQSSPSPKHSDQ